MKKKGTIRFAFVMFLLAAVFVCIFAAAKPARADDVEVQFSTAKAISVNKDIKAKVFGDVGKQKNRDMQTADLQIALNLKYFTESTLKSNGYYMLMPSDEIINSPF